MALSPAVRGRGLKQQHRRHGQLPGVHVARRARAWIETILLFLHSHCSASPAVRGRGLKRSAHRRRSPGAGVARRTRAWIETPRPRAHCRPWKTSPAVRGRGLKHHLRGAAAVAPVSPAVRGRGLKLVLAGYAGHLILSPAVRGRGLKRPVADRSSDCPCRPPYAGVD